MIILLVPIFMGLMTTGIMKCAQQENTRKRTGEVLVAPQRKKQDLGTTQISEEDKKHADNLNQLALAKRREIAQAFKRRASITNTPSPLIIHLPPQEEEPVDMQVVDLRGQMEAQDIDSQRHTSWCDQLTAMCTGSRRTSMPPNPPPLQRQYSYYPGRLSPEPLSPEPGSPEPGSVYHTTREQSK